MSAVVRPATRDDADSIAEVHVASWRWAYEGQLPDDVLAVLGEFGPLEGGERALLPIVLAGGPGLLARLSSRKLAALRRGLTIDVRLYVPAPTAALVPLPPRAPVAPPRRTGRPRTLLLAAL